jgi:nitrogen fixation NifU-like protein
VEANVFFWVRSDAVPRFSATLLDHTRHPRNAGDMPSPDAVGSSDPDSRAPRVWLFLRIAGGRVIDVKFQSMGCGCTIACCSVLTELLKGRMLEDCDHITAKSIAEELGGIPPDKYFSAELAIRAMESALDSWEESVE